MKTTHNSFQGPAAQGEWAKTPPTEQGTYWHWNGDDDSAPVPIFVLYSGFSGKCFVSMGQLGLEHAIDCDQYGGWWMPLRDPKTPPQLELEALRHAPPTAQANANEQVARLREAQEVLNAYAMAWGAERRAEEHIIHPDEPSGGSAALWKDADRLLQDAKKKHRAFKAALSALPQGSAQTQGEEALVRAGDVIEQMDRIHDEIMSGGFRCTCGEDDEFCRRCARSSRLSSLAHKELERINAAHPQFPAQSAGPGDAERGDEYWAGYKARMDEMLVEVPEPKHPTLWRYLNNAHEKKITFHRIGVNRMPDGGFHFYVHPDGVSGDTQDYLIWPDPFNWHDMLVNRLDSPPPDVEKFKAFLAKQFPAAMSASPDSREGKEGDK